jgi:chaperonin cofactor prefoldin
MGKDEQSLYDGELTTLMQEVRKLYELKLRNNTSNHPAKIERLEKRVTRLEEQIRKIAEQFNLTNQTG